MDNEHMNDFDDEEFDLDSHGKMTRMTERRAYRNCISAVPILTQNVILFLTVNAAATTALTRMVTSSLIIRAHGGFRK